MKLMEKVKRFRKTLSALLVIMLVALIMFGIILALKQLTSQPRTLYPGEIQNYQGENLSYIADVQENAIKGTQNINQSTYRLTITGLVNKTVEYTYDQVISDFQNYRKVVTLYCVEGWSAKILWEGFLVDDLLKTAGVNSSAVAAIFYASDGYSTALPLDYLTNHSIIIAYKMNGVTIPPERGFPFELVAESQYGYKWIKWITTIELTDNPDYLGYWESRGYPNNATIH
jgi:DMSO/TMAO reductase YedYZ molybdopterin-dependent catalytic subunit